MYHKDRFWDHFQKMSWDFKQLHAINEFKKANHKSETASRNVHIMLISAGVGAFAALIVLIFISCKIKKRCGKERRHSATYTGIDRQGANDL